VLPSRPLEAQLSPDVWTDIELQLDPDATWRCLGASPANQGRYGCVTDMGRALAHTHAVGFVVTPVPPDGAAEAPCDVSPSNCGAIAIDDFSVDVPVS
jgi:hypothetical protein